MLAYRERPVRSRPMSVVSHTQPTPTTDLLKAPMEICWNFDYAIDIEKLRNLYAKAKDAQWNAERDLDWDVALDPSRPIVDEAQFGFQALPVAFARRS